MKFQLKRNNAFTLVELLVSIAVLGIAIISLYSIFNYNYKLLYKIEDSEIALGLAQNLREEILSKPYSVKNKDKPYPDNSRINFQDIFDYNGYRDFPVTDIAGNVLENHKGFSIEVTVKYVEPDKRNNIIKANKSDYASITILVFKDKKEMLIVSFIMTNTE